MGGSSSSSILGALPGSTQSPSVSNKPILSRAAPDPTSYLTKSKYNVVEEGSTPLYVIPDEIKGLIKQDIVPRVLKKPLTPQTYKDYFAALLYAEDYYLEKWDEFEMKNVTLKLQEAELHGRKGKSINSNNDKIFVEFEVDTIPEKRPFLLSRDFASVRPSGRKGDPFQVPKQKTKQGYSKPTKEVTLQNYAPDWLGCLFLKHIFCFSFLFSVDRSFGCAYVSRIFDSNGQIYLMSRGEAEVTSARNSARLVGARPEIIDVALKQKPKSVEEKSAQKSALIKNSQGIDENVDLKVMVLL
ncbi:hypothetical protein POM88_015464 [Heracleum sosnowskyi]|uniref:Uncharacterized protein n=1 Tax=Heracleum sosnowskyi TaxID=360622 RepID=A0AAD8MVW6_9APIA|nr:hypothetical protein POM88_015464 [Heracleum sosnowskyi]